MIYNTVQDILKEFPQQNSAWTALDSCFVADASELGIPPKGSFRKAKDPWNRSFPNPPRPITNKENELVAWHFTTTVNGQEVECRILND